MKNRNITSKTIIVSALLWSVLSVTPAMGFSDEEIFIWVAGELNVEKSYDMPTIQYVDKKELEGVFRENNANSIKRWAREYGEKKASEMIDFYVSEVIGLFIPKTGALYVGDFIEPCKMESIVAHELTHYFQFMKEGLLDPNAKDAANKHLYNEMQAGNIEKKFVERFCSAAFVN